MITCFCPVCRKAWLGALVAGLSCIVPAPGPFRAESRTLPFDGCCWTPKMTRTSHLFASGNGPSSVLAAWSRINSETGQLRRALRTTTMDACGLRRASSQRSGMAMNANQGHFTCQSTPESLWLHQCFPTITSVPSTRILIIVRLGSHPCR